MTTEEIHFIKELVTENPTLYLDEIQAKLRDTHGIQVCVQTISNMLHNRLLMTRKTIWTVHPNQDEEERARYILQISQIPTECLVFTGEPL